MKVLSLFDGISCGMVALERAGATVERYDAYEIDPHAMAVSAKNYPAINHCGNVIGADFKQYTGFELLLGGSPCTYWSIARHGRETAPDGDGWRLYQEYVRALRESGCRYFIYENNHSIHRDIKAAISEQLGVQPVMINSALVSAQNRKRCYWTNIPGVAQPEDKGVLLQDILLKDFLPDAASPPLCLYEDNKRGFTEALPGDCVDMSYSTSKNHRGKVMHSKGKCLTTKNEWYQYLGRIPRKAGAENFQKGMQILTASGTIVRMVSFQAGDFRLYKIRMPDGDHIMRKVTPLEAERLQTLPDGYTDCVSTTQRFRGIGNGWTVDVISHILTFMPELKRF